jgi:hypothetical protein
MKILNRPMFRYGGPIKEGIMSGIKEPRRGYNQAGMVYPANVNQMLPTGINAGNAGKVFGNVKNQYTTDSLGDKINYNPYKKDFVTYQGDKMITEKDIDYNNDGRISTQERMKFKFQDDERKSDLIKKKYEPLIAKRNTTDKIITTQFGSYENPDYIPPGLDEKSSINIEKEKIGMPENISTNTGAGNKPDDKLPNLDDIKRDGLENNDGLSRKDKVNSILEGLGYDRAQKNALYDAMIKAGQRISRTGLGAENLVSDVIAETSQSYDKPEKLREAANLMQVQQDLKIDQIKATNEYKKNAYEEKEAYLTSILGDADLAKRISVGSPKNIIEAQKAVESAGLRPRTDKGVDATLAIYFDGVSGTPKYKGALSEDNTAALIALKGDKSIAEIKGESVDLDDGVYKLGKGYVDIRDGKIFDVREIISSFIED